MGQKPLEPDPTLPSAEWNDARCEAVFAKYREICKAMPTRTVLDLIRKPTIDMWQWEDYEVLRDHVGLRRGEYTLFLISYSITAQNLYKNGPYT